MVLKKDNVKWFSGVPILIKSSVIWAEDKSGVGRSVLVLSHRDSASFRTNELAVQLSDGFVPIRKPLKPEEKVMEKQSTSWKENRHHIFLSACVVFAKIWSYNLMDMEKEQDGMSHGGSEGRVCIKGTDPEGLQLWLTLIC